MATLAERAIYAFLTVHSRVYQGTNGWIGHWLPLAPNNLLLHTVGAKTGTPRTSTLSYARDGASYLIVASNGGLDRPPGWYFNLRANPRAEINVGPRRFGVTATIKTPEDPDYSRLFAIADDNNSHRYAAYQQKTSRPLQLVALTP
jgi:deazaflavin-dependent oxidoreductase (nitroreductase family)